MHVEGRTRARFGPSLNEKAVSRNSFPLGSPNFNPVVLT